MPCGPQGPRDIERSLPCSGSDREAMYGHSLNQTVSTQAPSPTAEGAASHRLLTEMCSWEEPFGPMHVTLI